MSKTGNAKPLQLPAKGFSFRSILHCMNLVEGYTLLDWGE
jgi:hypothetical protein